MKAKLGPVPEILAPGAYLAPPDLVLYDALIEDAEVAEWRDLELCLRAFRLPAFLAHCAPLVEQAAEGDGGTCSTSMSWPRSRPTSAAIGASPAYSTARGCRGTRRSRRSISVVSRPRCGHRSGAWRTGGCFEGATNLCIFGNPGVGKTHVMTAIGHKLVQAGHAVLFTPVSEFVENLIEAKRDLRLGRELRRLDRFTCWRSTTSATCSRTAPRWRYSSPSRRALRAPERDDHQ